MLIIEHLFRVRTFDVIQPNSLQSLAVITFHAGFDDLKPNSNNSWKWKPPLVQQVQNCQRQEYPTQHRSTPRSIPVYEGLKFSKYVVEVRKSQLKPLHLTFRPEPEVLELESAATVTEVLPKFCSDYPAVKVVMRPKLIPG